MRHRVALIGLILFMGLFIQACAKPTYIRVDPRKAFSEVETSNDRYPKTAVVVRTAIAGTPLERQTQDYFLQRVTAAIREESASLRLLSPDETALPALLETPNLLDDGADVFAVCQKARAENVQYLIQGRVMNISGEERKTGFWWFRKTRYFIDVDVAVDVFDTTTGTKLFSQVESQETKVHVDDYEAFRSGTLYEIPRVNVIVADMAENLGEEAAESIRDSRWLATVIGVQADQIALSPGSSVGVKIGDRFVIFEGRRIVNGPDGGKYVVPGYKITDARAIAVEPGKTEVLPDGEGAVQPGDIASPAK